MVTVVVPLWIALAYAVQWQFPDSFFGSLAIAAGLAALAGGFALFVSCVLHFAAEEGTLAPWDPPRGLVVRGAYRYVRNPMISGVIFVLLGEALVLRSLPHRGLDAGLHGPQRWCTSRSPRSPGSSGASATRISATARTCRASSRA